MFTGIITDIGTVRDIRQNGITRFNITSRYDMGTVALGASIACNGVCLTVVETGPDWFGVELSQETLSMTTLGQVGIGDRLNLEQALKIGDALGGHIVSGHVDGVATLVGRHPEGESVRFRFRLPDAFARFVAPKGSITLDGVSLTVNEVDGAEFGVNVIPHTQQATTLDDRQAGDRVNFEIDMLARYVARLTEKD